MEAKDIFTLIGLSVSIIGLFVTFLKLAQEQRKANQIKLSAEKRTEYKLRIYQILIDDCLDFDELTSKFRQQTPVGEIDQIELRKCIYEMLVEGTLVTFQDGSYTADTMDEEDD